MVNRKVQFLYHVGFFRRNGDADIAEGLEQAA
jgi:hypothetical protein